MRLAGYLGALAWSLACWAGVVVLIAHNVGPMFKQIEQVLP